MNCLISLISASILLPRPTKYITFTFTLSTQPGPSIRTPSSNSYQSHKLKMGFLIPALWSLLAIGAVSKIWDCPANSNPACCANAPTAIPKKIYGCLLSLFPLNFSSLRLKEAQTEWYCVLRLECNLICGWQLHSARMFHYR
jgi:hypothetical protein